MEIPDPSTLKLQAGLEVPCPQLSPQFLFQLSGVSDPATWILSRPISPSCPSFPPILPSSSWLGLNSGHRQVLQSTQSGLPSSTPEMKCTFFSTVKTFPEMFHCSPSCAQQHSCSHLLPAHQATAAASQNHRAGKTMA